MKAMLDDLKYLHERDGQDALGTNTKQWQQLEYEFGIGNWELGIGNCENIVFAGMGGSALAALVSSVWPAYSLPFEIVRGYDIPKYVSNKTLFFASSYSGNTEETVSALEQAQKAGAQIVVMASNGRLKEIAAANNYPLVELPSGYMPRYTTLFGLKGITGALDSLGLSQNASAQLASKAGWLKDQISTWLPDVPTSGNKAKQIAQELMGKSPVIYAGPKLWPAAYKWKINLNENAKNVAWCNQLPEFNHNEFPGWSSHPTEKPYAIVELRSNLDHPKIQKRFELSGRLLSGLWPDPITLEAEGKTILEQLLYSLVLGDFVSLYLAMLNNVNPTPVDLIEKLKAELKSQ